MTLIFTNFHQLSAICDIRIDGSFTPNWNKQYIEIIQGKKKKNKYIKPDGVGSGLKSKPLKLKMSQSSDELTVKALGELTSALAFNQIIYVIVSKRYPILYVGISEGGLLKGVLKDGRLRHHLHKMLAIRESGTSHTAGWLQHAIERYDANVLAREEISSEQVFKAGLLDDIYIAIGHCGHDNWKSKQVEGTVLDMFKAQIDSPDRPIQIINTATVKYDPIAIQLPGNIANF
jgi:hypothetical protein